MNTRSNLSIFKNQGTAVEVTVRQQLNQGECTHVLYLDACLSFLVLFLSKEKVHKKFTLLKENIPNNNRGNHANKISSKTSPYGTAYFFRFLLNPFSS